MCGLTRTSAELICSPLMLLVCVCVRALQWTCRLLVQSSLVATLAETCSWRADF